MKSQIAEYFPGKSANAIALSYNRGLKGFCDTFTEAEVATPVKLSNWQVDRGFERIDDWTQKEILGGYWSTFRQNRSWMRESGKGCKDSIFDILKYSCRVVQLPEILTHQSLVLSPDSYFGNSKFFSRNTRNCTLKHPAFQNLEASRNLGNTGIKSLLLYMWKILPPPSPSLTHHGFQRGSIWFWVWCRYTTEEESESWQYSNISQEAMDCGRCQAHQKVEGGR